MLPTKGIFGPIPLPEDLNSVFQVKSEDLLEMDIPFLLEACKKAEDLVAPIDDKGNAAIIRVEKVVYNLMPQLTYIFHLRIISLGTTDPIKTNTKA